MSTITLKTRINAPIEACFDLARSIDLHLQSMQSSKEEAIAGRQTGLINLGETVTWKANHFGLNFSMKIKITQMEYPIVFIDEMVNGPFKKLHHQHKFKSFDTHTEMIDIFEFIPPFGLLGKLVNSVILEKYMRKLLVYRNNTIKTIAEATGLQRKNPETLLRVSNYFFTSS